MFNAIVTVVSIFSVLDLRSAECACYRFDDVNSFNYRHAALTNDLCRNMCEVDSTNNRYYGTYFENCFCLETVPSSWIDKDGHCTTPCPGNQHEMCGGTLGKSQHKLMTVSDIEQTIEAVTVQNTQATSATSISRGDTAMADVNSMLTSETSPAIVTQSTPYTMNEILSSTSANEQSAISTVITDTLTPRRTSILKTEQITEAVTVQNTKATSATSISIRYTTTADVNGMLTIDTSLGTVTRSTPYTVKEIFSLTSANTGYAISTVMTETSTPIETEQTTEAVTVQYTKATSATSVYIRSTTTSDVNGMLTSHTSPATVTQSMPGNGREMSSSISENVKFEISSVMNEISTPARTVNRPKKLLCECPKKHCNTKWHFIDGADIADSEVRKLVLEDFYQNILSKIIIDKQSVTKEARKRNSAINKTKSAKFIGWGCIVFLILPTAIVIAIDLLNCCFHFQKRSRRSKHGKRSRVKAISGDRDIPLEEIVSSVEDYYASRCGNNFHPDEIKRETYHRRRVDPC